MYYCRVVYVLLYIPMKTKGGGGGPPPPPPPPESTPASFSDTYISGLHCLQNFHTQCNSAISHITIQFVGKPLLQWRQDNIHCPAIRVSYHVGRSVGTVTTLPILLPHEIGHFMNFVQSGYTKMKTTYGKQSCSSLEATATHFGKFLHSKHCKPQLSEHQNVTMGTRLRVYRVTIRTTTDSSICMLAVSVLTSFWCVYK